MEEINLNNGVIIVVNDRTVPLAGDLYMVHLEIMAKVILDAGDSQLRRYCAGDELCMIRDLKKPAVLERDLDAVRSSMKDSFLATNLPYMDRPWFVNRFKAKMLNDFKEQEEKENRSSNK